MQGVTAPETAGPMEKAEYARAKTDRLPGCHIGTVLPLSGADAAVLDIGTSTETPLKRRGTQARYTGSGRRNAGRGL